jgi:hypothetical protein
MSYLITNKNLKAIAFLALLFAANFSFGQTSKDSLSNAWHNSCSSTAKGTISISGSIAYGTTTTVTGINLNQYTTKADSVPIPNNKSTATSISIGGSYFVINNLAVGLSFAYNNTSAPEIGQGSNNEYYSWNNISNSFSVGVFATKYFFITNKFYFYTIISCNYNAGNTYNSYFVNSPSSPKINAYPMEPTTGYSLALGTGFIFYPTSHWGFALTLKDIVTYNSSMIKDSPLNSPANASNVVTENKTTNVLSIGVSMVPALSIDYVFAK